MNKRFRSGSARVPPEAADVNGVPTMDNVRGCVGLSEIVSRSAGWGDLRRQTIALDGDTVLVTAEPGVFETHAMGETFQCHPDSRARRR